MLELGKDEGCAGYLGGAVGVGGDVLDGGPAPGEQGEAALAAAAEVVQLCVPASGVDVEVLVSGRLSRGT